MWQAAAMAHGLHQQDSGPAIAANDLPRLGLVWGFDFADGDALPLGDGDMLPAPDAAAFRWLHLNLADMWTQRWIGEIAPLPDAVRELLLSPEKHQRALVDGGTVACAVQDFERDFDARELASVGVLTFALQPMLMITARHHPLSCADVMRRRIDRGARPADAAEALDLLLGAVAEVGGRVSTELTLTVQAAEDALIDFGRAPEPRALVEVRRRAVLLHRQLVGLRGVLLRLEADSELPAALLPTVEKQLQRVVALDADVLEIQGNLRQLREEVDMQTASRTNSNLYILSLLTALLLPPTLVTGFFGMNTGGLPFEHADHGTAVALAVMVGVSLAVFLWLQARGFFRR